MEPHSHLSRWESHRCSCAHLLLPCSVTRAVAATEASRTSPLCSNLGCVRAQYSFSLTTFSPSGKLVQIEYALNAVSQGATSLGIKAANGVVIATEKKLQSTLVEEETVQKISLLTPNIGVAYSGMGPDSRVLVRKARKQAQVCSAGSLLAQSRFLGLTRGRCRRTIACTRSTYRSPSCVER